MKSGPQQTRVGGDGNYKFQRVRGRLRQAVQRGELSGKLPGERELARRYEVNAKTISKALTDLASEGLLIRQVGRGTFVADQLDGRYAVGRAQRYRWLVRAGDSEERSHAVFELAASRLRRAGHYLSYQSVQTDQAGRLEAGWLAPGKLRQVDGVIIFSCGPSEELVADLHRRRIPLVLTACHAYPIKSNAVHPDWARGVFELTEQLIWTGHRQIGLALPRERPFVAVEAERGYGAALGRYGVSWKCVIGDTAEELAAAASNSVHPTAVIGLAGDRRRRIEDALGRADGSGARGPAVALVLPPGEPLPAAEGGLGYRFDEQALVDWTTKLLMEATPGHQPREVVFPGQLVGSTPPPAGGSSRDEVVVSPRVVTL